MIWQQVDDGLHHLSQINDKCIFKSQRGGNETVWVKQNHIFRGPDKSRISYDSLSIFQWVLGFCTIAKEETDQNVKNLMLEYISDLMKNAQDFG